MHVFQSVAAVMFVVSQAPSFTKIQLARNVMFVEWTRTYKVVTFSSVRLLCLAESSSLCCIIALEALTRYFLPVDILYAYQMVPSEYGDVVDLVVVIVRWT